MITFLKDFYCKTFRCINVQSIFKNHQAISHKFKKCLSLHMLKYRKLQNRSPRSPSSILLWISDIRRSLVFEFLLNKIQNFHDCFSLLFHSRVYGTRIINTYKMLQFDCNFSTSLGWPPTETFCTISTTSLKSGKALFRSLEWISVEFTLTSNDVLRPTNPLTCASGTVAFNKK